MLQGFIDTHERGDAAAAAAMVADDIRITMPPHPFLFEGREAMALLLERAFGPETPGDWLLVPTRANRQPTAASYLRQPGDSEYRAFKFDVLRVEGGVIAEITTFDASLFDAFGLSPTWRKSSPRSRPAQSSWMSSAITLSSPAAVRRSAGLSRSKMARWRALTQVVFSASTRLPVGVSETVTTRPSPFSPRRRRTNPRSSSARSERVAVGTARSAAAAISVTVAARSPTADRTLY